MKASTVGTLFCRSVPQGSSWPAMTAMSRPPSADVGGRVPGACTLGGSCGTADAPEIRQGRGAGGLCQSDARVRNRGGRLRHGRIRAHRSRRRASAHQRERRPADHEDLRPGPPEGRSIVAGGTAPLTLKGDLGAARLQGTLTGIDQASGEEVPVAVDLVWEGGSMIDSHRDKTRSIPGGVVSRGDNPEPRRRGDRHGVRGRGELHAGALAVWSDHQGAGLFHPGGAVEPRA